MIRFPELGREAAYGALVAGLLAVLVLLELLLPQPVDWTPTLDVQDKRPYGTRVLRELLPDLFPGAPVASRNLPPYYALRDTTRGPFNYLFITRSFDPDEAERRHLLRFAARGGSVFVAASRLDEALGDTFGIEIERRSSGMPELPVPLEPSADTAWVRFTSSVPGLAEAFGYPAALVDGYLAVEDSLRWAVLARTASGEPVLARRAFGEGHIYLCSIPLVFTNYAMLEGGNARFAYAALSHLPVREVMWDTYYSPSSRRAQTPLRYILTAVPLRTAWYVLLLTTLLFALTQGRRRQRAIPVVQPPRNDTTDFVRTVGHLYLRQADHAALAKKRLAYLTTYLHRRLGLDVNLFRGLSPGEVERIASRSGAPVEAVRALAETAREVRSASQVDGAMLRRLSGRIDAFYAAARA